MSEPLSCLDCNNCIEIIKYNGNPESYTCDLGNYEIDMSFEGRFENVCIRFDKRNEKSKEIEITDLIRRES